MVIWEIWSVSIKEIAYVSLKQIIGSSELRTY